MECLITKSLYFSAMKTAEPMGRWAKKTTLAEDSNCDICFVVNAVLFSVKATIKNVLTKCLEKETQRWKEDKEPEKLNGHFQSELLAIIVIQVIQICI